MSRRKYREAARLKRVHEPTEAELLAADRKANFDKTDPAVQSAREMQMIRDQAQMLRVLRMSL